MSEPNQQQSGASPDAVKQEGTVTKEDILLAAAIRLGDEIRDQSVEHAKALVKPLISHFKAAIENAVGKEGRDIELVLYGYDECSKINFHALLDCLEVQFIDVLVSANIEHVRYAVVVTIVDKASQCTAGGGYRSTRQGRRIVADPRGSGPIYFINLVVRAQIVDVSVISCVVESGR